MDAPEILRVMLMVGTAVMLLLALLFLRGRRLAWWQFCAWGLLALCLPLIGPFLVIVLRPTGHPAQRRAAALRRAHPRGLGRVI